MNLIHVLLRYRMSRLLPVADSPADLLNSLKRNLEVRGLRPLPGTSYESLLERLRAGTYTHISELYEGLGYVDGPDWEGSLSPYAPCPEALAEAQRLFSAAMDHHVYEDDVLDNVMSTEWDHFIQTGKTALYVFCRGFQSASQVRTPQDRGDVIRECLVRINEESSRLVDIPDFPALVVSLRLNPERLGPRGETPTGLLKPLSQLLSAPSGTFEVPLPDAWWKTNERHVPDLRPLPDRRGIDIDALP